MELLMSDGQRGAWTSRDAGAIAVPDHQDGPVAGTLTTMSAQSRAPAIITVCTSCRLPGAEREAAPGRQLFEAVVAAASDEDNVVVRPTQCLSICSRICSAAISGEAAYTFLFGDIDPATGAIALVDMAVRCHRTPHGFVPWAERPEPLRKGIVARLAPPGWSPDDGSAPA